MKRGWDVTLGLARKRRKWRTEILKWYRRTGLVAATINVLGHTSAVIQIGNTLRNFVSQVMGIFTPTNLKSLDSTDATSLLPNVISAALGTAVFVLGVWVVYQIGFLGWKSWESLEQEQFFGRVEYSVGGAGFSVFVIATVTLVGSPWLLDIALPDSMASPAGAWLMIPALIPAALLTKIATQAHKSHG